MLPDRKKQNLMDNDPTPEICEPRHISKGHTKNKESVLSFGAAKSPGSKLQKLPF